MMSIVHPSGLLKPRLLLPKSLGLLQIGKSALVCMCVHTQMHMSTHTLMRLNYSLNGTGSLSGTGHKVATEQITNLIIS